MGLGTGEIILLFIVVMVIFGSTKLPQLGDGLGRAIKNFKRAVSSQNEIDVSAKRPDKTAELKPELKKGGPVDDDDGPVAK
jgi:sec-independent protein translocase protein TatA